MMKTIRQPHQATLCFLIQGHPPERILLGFKKRGFGKGKIGGFGGKIESEESAQTAAARELWEESGLQVMPEQLDYKGHLTFLFPAKTAWNQIVHVFLGESWAGQPTETTEMKPLWYDVADIPYGQMWEDNAHWLPMVLKGEFVRAIFTFKQDNESVEKVRYVTGHESNHADLDILMTTLPSNEEREFIHQAIKAFNNEISPYHLAARQPDAVKPLNLFVHSREGQIVGGLTADTFWNWMAIDDFWLHDSLRGQGIGSRLLAMAEDEAVRRGCRWVKLETFSFQARDFYEKQGYSVVGALPDYPPGASLYWMYKDLALDV